MQKILLLVVLFFGFQLSHGQDKALSIQARFTPEFSNINHPLLDTEAKFSLGGGLIMEKGFNNWLAAQVGILYKNRGWQTKIHLTNNAGEVTGKKDLKENLKYFSIPVLVKGEFNKFYLSAGPSVDLFLNRNSDFDDNSSNVKKLNASLYLGAGYRLELNEMLFIDIEANYNKMLFAINQNSPIDVSTYSYGPGFSLGYKL